MATAMEPAPPIPRCATAPRPRSGPPSPPRPEVAPVPRPGPPLRSGRSASSDPAPPSRPVARAAATTTTETAARRPSRSADGWSAPPWRRPLAPMRMKTREWSRPADGGIPPTHLRWHPPSDCAPRQTTPAPTPARAMRTARQPIHSRPPFRRQPPAAPGRTPVPTPTGRSPPRATPHSRTVAMLFRPWIHSLRFDGATAASAPNHALTSARPGRSLRMPLLAGLLLRRRWALSEPCDNSAG